MKNHESQIQFKDSDNHQGGVLIDSLQGAQNGFSMGISLYHSSNYGTPGIHDDQEGFYVIEGSGMAKVGDIEFSIKAGSAFLVPPGVKHTLKKDSSSPLLKVLWTHGAV